MAGADSGHTSVGTPSCSGGSGGLGGRAGCCGPRSVWACPVASPGQTVADAGGLVP